MAKEQDAAHAEDIRRARKVIGLWLRYLPLTVADKNRLERLALEDALKTIFRRYAEKNPQFMRFRLEDWIAYALDEQLRNPWGDKDNQVRDKTLGLIIGSILVHTTLKPTRNQATNTRHSACSIVAEVLTKRGLKVSEPVVENAWKIYARTHPDLKAGVADMKRRIAALEKHREKSPTPAYNTHMQRQND